MGYIWVWGVALAVLGGTLWFTGIVQVWLRQRAILDHPVDRSSHSVPVPRGGGLALIPALVVAWLGLAAAGIAPAGTPVIALGAAALALLSWYDDLHSLPAGLRLLAHFAAAALGVATLADAGLVFQGALPVFFDRAGAVLLWVWFVNLYNFMDGIDGITGGESVAIGIGVAAALTLTGQAASGAAALALCVAAGALGFLRWNWPPARIFLGDIGSVPLGYLLGWLLLFLAAKGLWAPALILPLYYLADASFTLLKRILRGERFWLPHRQHFYQRAVAPGSDHAGVLRLVLGGNLLLLLLALLAIVAPIPALILAAVVTAAMLALLERRAAAHQAS
jgi:UDP-N-acetylmuramyl pentapeptide phosphotransferase/UDP-N-acetylglucosamine-1-phosphate transferase